MEACAERRTVCCAETCAGGCAERLVERPVVANSGMHMPSGGRMSEQRGMFMEKYSHHLVGAQ